MNEMLSQQSSKETLALDQGSNNTIDDQWDGVGGNKAYKVGLKNQLIGQKLKEQLERYSPGSAASSTKKKSKTRKGARDYTFGSKEALSKPNSKKNTLTSEQRLSKTPNNDNSRNTAYNRYVDQYLETESVLDFKLMEKPRVRQYRPQDFKVVEETIQGLENLYPSKQRSKSNGQKASKGDKIITQKQVIGALEQTIYHSKVHKDLEFEDQNHIQRLLLKVHTQLLKVKQTMPISRQVQIMLKFLNYETSKIETKILADQTYSTCLLQKTFLALMLNMAKCSEKLTSLRSESRNSQNMTFRISVKQGRNSYQNLIESRESASRQPKSILKSSENTSLYQGFSPNKKIFSGETILSSTPSKTSPERALKRQKEKADSPVRNFLDDEDGMDEEVGPIQKYKENNDLDFDLRPVKVSQHQNEQEISESNNGIQQSLMFDNKLSFMENTFQSQTNLITQRNQKQTKADMDLLLKMRVWEKDELKGQHQDLAKKDMQTTSIEHCYDTVAETHYHSQLMRKTIHGLIIFVVETNKELQGLCLSVQKRQAILLARNTLYALRQTTLDLKMTREINQLKMDKSEEFYGMRLKRKVFDSILGLLDGKKKEMLVTLRRQLFLKSWKHKKAIFTHLKHTFLTEVLANTVKQTDFRKNILSNKLMKGLRMDKDRMSELIKWRKNRDRPGVLAMVVKEWKQIAKANRAHIKFVMKVRGKVNRTKRFVFFKAWKQLKKEVLIGKQIRGQILKQTAFNGFLKLEEMQERKRLLQQACDRHLVALRMKQIWEAWREMQTQQKKYREFQLSVFNRMDLLRQRQIIKAWFNQIDILKKWKSLEDNTEMWHERKSLKFVFMAWRKKSELSQMKNRFLAKHMKIQQQFWLRQMVKVFKYSRLAKEMEGKHQAMLRHRHFSAWLTLMTQNHNMKKCRFICKAKRQLKKQCLMELCKNSVMRRNFKNGMKSLLKLRANNLMREAYVNGLKKDWHQRVIYRNLLKAAKYYNKARLIKNPFKVLKNKWISSDNNRKVNSQHVLILKKHYLKIWIKRFIIGDVSIRFVSRRMTNLKFQIFKSLQKEWRNSKNLKYRLTKFDRIHLGYLKERTFSALKALPGQKKEKLSRYSFLKEKVFYPNLIKSTFKKLQTYEKYRKNRKKLMMKMAVKGDAMVMKESLGALKEYMQLVGKTDLFSYNRLLRLKFNCIHALNRKPIDRKRVKNMKTKVNKRIKKTILFEIFQVKNLKIFLNEKHQELFSKTLVETKSKIFSGLKQYSKNKIIDRLRAFQLRELRQKTNFKAWNGLMRDCIDEKEDRLLASALWKKHMFDRLRFGAKNFKEDISISIYLDSRTRAFYDMNSKRRAVQMLFKNMNDGHLDNLKKEFTTRVVVKRIFNAWYETLDTFKRKRILKDTALVMWNNLVLERTFASMRNNAEQRARDRAVVKQFNERAVYNKKVLVIVNLHQNIIDQKVQKTSFYNKMVFLAEKRVEPAFEQWKTFLNDQHIMDKADKFYKMRHAQYLVRLSVDSLLINNLKRKQRKIQISSINSWYNKILLTRCILTLKCETYDRMRVKNIRRIIGHQTDAQIQRTFFDLLKQGIHTKQGDRELLQKARSFFEKNSFRKTFIAIQLYIFNKQRILTITNRNIKRTQVSFLRRWMEKFVVSKKLHRFEEILQDQKDQMNVQKFFPSLVESQFFYKVGKHMENRRVINITQEFFNQIRKQVLQAKICCQFIITREMKIQKDVMVQLRLHAVDRKRFKKNLITHLTQNEEESNLDIIQIAFNALKERSIIKKFSKISITCFQLRTVKKGFIELQRNAIKRQIEKNNVREVNKIQEAKYLWIWRKIYIKEREKQDAIEFVQSTFMHQMVESWRKITEKSTRARAFYKNVVQRNSMSFSLLAWQKVILKKKRVAELGKRMEKLHIQNMKTVNMFDWIQQTQENKISKQMREFYALKRFKEIFPAWKHIKDTKNERRRNVYIIREKLQARPELSRPLLVLKNLLLFKTFNKLIEGAALEYDEQQLNMMADTQYYVNTSRKTFLSLKLNAQLGIQKDQVMELTDLFLKRRWLNYIKEGTRYLKERRKDRHKASILRFLCLQKKAIQALVTHSVENQEMRIKKQYALQLYYKRVLDLGLSSLKVYREYRQKKCIEKLELIKNQKEEQKQTLLQSNLSRIQDEDEDLASAENQENSGEFGNNMFSAADFGSIQLQSDTMFNLHTDVIEERQEEEEATLERDTNVFN